MKNDSESFRRESFRAALDAAARTAILLVLGSLVCRPLRGQELLHRLLRNAETTERTFAASLQSRTYVFSMDFALLDRSGKTGTEQVETYRVEARTGQPPRFTLLWATRNGTDITSDVARRNERARQKGGSGRPRSGIGRMADFSPFSQVGRKHHRFSLAAQTADGNYRVEIEPIEPQTDDPTDVRVRGEAVFDRATERLKSMRVVPARMPPHLTALEVERRFDPSTDLPESLSANGEARFLLIFHKRFRVVTRWKFDRGTEGGG